MLGDATLGPLSLEISKRCQRERELRCRTLWRGKVLRGNLFSLSQGLFSFSCLTPYLRGPKSGLALYISRTEVLDVRLPLLFDLRTPRRHVACAHKGSRAASWLRSAILTHQRENSLLRASLKCLLDKSQCWRLRMTSRSSVSTGSRPRTPLRTPRK